MEIIVNYEEARKNGDMSALTCYKPNNKYVFEKVVGAVSNEADEILKIVSKQGYLKEHDSELLDKVIQKCDALMNYTDDSKTNAYCITPEGYYIAREQLLKVIAELKAEVEQ